jgi:hypothetical protein
MWIIRDFADWETGDVKHAGGPDVFFLRMPLKSLGAGKR